MKKLDTKGIPQGWLRSAKMDFCHEGIMRGMLMVELDMALEMPGEDAWALGVIRLLDKLKMPKRRIVRLVGALSNDDAMFTLMVNMLHDHGWEVQAVVTGTTSPMWLKWVKWLVLATGQDVVPFRAQELWYSPLELKDPLFPSGSEGMICQLAGRFGVDELEDFLATSAYAWAVRI